MATDLDYEYLKKHPAEFVEQILDVERVFDYQREFLESSSKRKVFVAGRQVGKSRVASWMALHYAVTHPNSLVLVTADALRQSSELFAQLQAELYNSDLTDEQWGIKRSTQTEIEFTHHSRIKVVPTGRNGNKIRGFTADLIIADEAAFIEDSIFEEVIEPMTFVSDGTIALCSTPFGASGYFFQKARNARNDSSRWLKIQVSSYDNPEIDEQTIEEYKQGKTDKQIRQEVLGEFVPVGDQFFPSPLIRSCMTDAVERGVVTYADPKNDIEREMDRQARIYAGADLGASGDDMTVISLVDEYGNIFSVEKKDIGLVEARERVEQLDALYNFETINVDRTGLGEGPVAELRNSLGNKVNDVYLSTQTKQSVYQTMKAQMEAGRVLFPNDEDIKTQMEKLGEDKTKTGNLSIHAKGNFHDDIPDSMALAVYALPDVAGKGSMGAQGMTEAMTIGKMVGEGRNKRYQIGGHEQDDSEELDRTMVGSTVVRTNV